MLMIRTCNSLLKRVALIAVFAMVSRFAHASDTTQNRDWSMFRGNAQQTGVAPCELRGKPKVRWSHAVPDTGFIAAPAIVGKTVYIGDDMGTMHALDFATGKVRWQRSVGDSIAINATPTVIDGVLLFGDDAGIMHALNAKDGTTRWTFKTEGPIVSSVNLSGKRMVFGSYDGSVYCLDRTSGKLVWKCETEDKLHGTPGIAKDRVLVAGCDSRMHVIDLASGAERCRIDIESVSGSSAAIIGDRVFIGTYGNQVLGIDLSAKKILWRFEHPDRQFPYLSSAALTEKLVVIGGRDKNVYALNQATGKPTWTFPAKGRVEASAVIAGDLAIVGTQKGVLFGIDINTGKPAWQFEAGDSITASVGVARNCIVFGTDDGVLYCLEGKPPES